MVPIQVDHEMHPHKMGLANYIRALEEEKKKIQVFPRDLPLSLELVTQAIEKCIQHLSGTELNLNGQSECSARISTEEGLVFEDFIPIKQRASSSSSSSDCDEAEEHSSHQMKSDWLRSVQLWSSNPLPAKETVPRKTSVVEVKRNSGAFHPFYKEEIAAEACKALITSPEDVPATSSTEPVVESSSKIEDKGQRKKRRCWSQELHKRFLHALQQLGGSHSATPKQIRELMKVDGLTNDEVKSHLQKFRLHTRRSPVIHNNAIANSPTAPLFLVGNIYEYVAAAVATTSTVSGELTTVTTPTGIYAPVATHPTLTTTTVIQPRFKKQHLCENSHSEERANHSEGVVVQSNSSATSYSTHTTTTSLRC